jgi:hypothetical protein
MYNSQQPEGFLESNFVTVVAKWGLRLSHGSRRSYGYPYAMYALIMAGVSTPAFFFFQFIDAASQLERGFRSFKLTGVHIPPSRFTKADWSTTLSEFMENTKRITPEDWAAILKAAKSKKTSSARAAEEDPDTSILQQFRSQIYVPRPKPAA